MHALKCAVPVAPIEVSFPQFEMDETLSQVTVSNVSN